MNIITAEILIKLTCKEFGVKISEIKKQNRENGVYQARHALCYVLKEWHGWSYERIGKRITRNHATIVNDVKKAKILLAKDSDFASSIFSISQSVEDIETGKAEPPRTKKRLVNPVKADQPLPSFNFSEDNLVLGFGR